MLGIKGRFHIGGLIVHNIIPNEGEEAFLKMIAQGAVADVALGGNFYMGLCTNTNVGPTSVLGDLSEMSGGGYARQAIERDATGFPTVDATNGIYRALSKTVNFAASGADIGPFTRSFLCNVSSGTAGKLLAISGELPAPVTIVDTDDMDAVYELFLGYTG